MSKQIKYVLGVLAMLFSVVGTQAQNNNTSTGYDEEMIVMPKDEFVDAVAKAVNERRKKNAKIEAELYQLKLQQRRLQQQGGVTKDNVTNEDYNTRFNRLEDQIRQLMIMFAGNNGATGSNVTYLPRDNQFGNYSTNPGLGFGASTTGTSSFKVDDSTLKQEINRLVAETERLKSLIDHNSANAPKSAYDGQVSEIFFDNDKYNLSSTAVSTIDDVVSILKSDERLDIMVKGFASKVGNSIYNHNLSMKRTDEVKQAFISKGIAPGRVLSTYHGEDLSNRSVAESRRVDIIILDSRK
ncbi:OmpA family protein [Balneicella halophila]|uniref:OmpA family protein n=1 Tax=Balneicella halophila TaxID=1537566 RepID=A0A7L4UP15_BALHA|nr:OmpA family protein [Balneicella halophila]PVX50078.1 OmpA family protein [Balneicella halophila]